MRSLLGLDVDRHADLDQVEEPADVGVVHAHAAVRGGAAHGGRRIGGVEADVRRVGVHSERGEESVAHMIKMYAGHDLLHLAQLARIRRAVSSVSPSR